MPQNSIKKIFFQKYVQGFCLIILFNYSEKWLNFIVILQVIYIRQYCLYDQNHIHIGIIKHNTKLFT